MASDLKYIKTTLDTLPAWDEDRLPQPGSRLKNAPLPEGITHKMLYSDVILIAWPAFIELVLTQLTSMADQIMVGRLSGGIGVQALAAVGLCNQPKFLLMTAMQALNTGTTAMVARFRGQGSRDKANQVFRQSLLLNLIIGIFCSIFGIVFTLPLVRLTGGNGISEETVNFAVQYLRIQMYGFLPLCFTFTITAVLRGIGDSRTPLFYNTAANIINIILNYMLIYGKCGFPAMQVAGASLATVIGQSVAFVIAFFCVMRKNRYIYLSFRERFRVDWNIMYNVVAIGIPSMIEQLFMRFGVIYYNRTIATLGDVPYATHQVCMNIQAMSFMCGQAFANSATTLMGQSLGKRRTDMAEIYTRHTQNVGIAVSIAIGLGLIFLGRPVVSLYNSTPEVISLGGSILIMVGFTQPFQALQFITAGALRGAGDTRFPAIVSFVTIFVLRSILATLFVRVIGLGLWGAWYALVIDQTLRTALIFFHYRHGQWRFIRLHGSNS